MNKIMDKQTEDRLLLLVSAESSKISKEAIKSIRSGFKSSNLYIENSITHKKQLIQEHLEIYY